jgi:branched-chain amino acid transport system permease protein
MHLSMTRTGPRQASTMHTAIIAAVVLALAFAAIPLLDNYSLYVVSLICVYAIFATGYNLLMGYAGQFDVGQAAFLALGAYGSAVMQSRFGVPVLVSVFIGAGIAVLAGLAIGVIVLRLRHFYLALVTLAFSQTVVLALSLWRDVTRGFQGMPVESVNLFGLGRNISAYIVIVTATVILITLAYNLVRSNLGRAFEAIRESEVAAQAMGINLTRTRLTAYAISAFYGGFAGGLLAILLSYITPEGFTIFETIKVLSMIVVGGMGSIFGGLLGAALLTLGNEMLRFSLFFQEIGFGLLLVVCIILMPEGVVGLWNRVVQSWRREEDGQ